MGAFFVGRAMYTQVMTPKIHKTREFHGVHKVSWWANKTPTGIDEIAKEIDTTVSIRALSGTFRPTIPKGSSINRERRTSNMSDLFLRSI
jgi:hypothetical protein